MPRRRQPELTEEQTDFCRDMRDEGASIEEIRAALDPSAPGVTATQIARALGLLRNNGTIAASVNTRVPWNPARAPKPAIIEKMRRGQT